MVITIQNLQDLSNVTSLSQVHIVEGISLTYGAHQPIGA